MLSPNAKEWKAADVPLLPKLSSIPVPVEAAETTATASTAVISSGEAQPSTATVSAPVTPAPSSKARLCKNVIIYGFCKFEGKGCVFNHSKTSPTAMPAAPVARTAALAEPEINSNVPSRLSATSPVFTPQRHTSQLMGPGVHDATERMGSLDLGGAALASNGYAYHAYEATPGAQPQQIYGQSTIGGMYQAPVRRATTMPYPVAGGVPHPLTRGMSSLGFTTDNENGPEYVMPRRTMSAGEAAYGNELDDDRFVFQPLQHHLYTAPLHNLPSLAPNQRRVHGFFVADSLRRELLEKQEELTHNLTIRDPDLPTEVHVYHTLFPLEERHVRFCQLSGYPTRLYKGVSRMDGRSYLLRRIEGYHVAHQANMVTAEAWRRLRHANLVSVREVFNTKAFGDHSLVVVYDYYPQAPTLFEKHLSATQSGHQAGAIEQMQISESQLWSYLVQLLSAMKAVHSSGLALRVLDLTSILLTNRNRLRIGCCSLYDIMGMDSSKTIHHLQQEDMLQLGQLIVTLACQSPNAMRLLPKSLEYMSNRFSQEIKNIALFLLSKPSPLKKLDDVITMCNAHILQEMNTMQLYNDQLENELTRELENGRLVRLLCKFGFINERPEFDMDPQWSETGDRYLLKLFRDYVFHQVNEHGRPVVDLAHVISCLNKLDAGVDEKVMLMSRDEQSCLIVSYRELKNCVAQAFSDLSHRQ